MEFDLDLALERTFWAAEAGLVGFTVGGPVGMAAGVVLGGSIPDLVDYWDGDPAPATAVAATDASVARAYGILDAWNAQPDVNLTEQEYSDARRYVTETIWNYSTRKGVAKAFDEGGAGDGANLADLFAAASEKLVEMGGEYVDFFKSLYEETAASAEMLDEWQKEQAALGGSTTGLFPRKPKPPAPAPPTPPAKKEKPLVLYVIILIVVVIVAAIIMKMRKKKKRGGRRR